MKYAFLILMVSGLLGCSFIPPSTASIAWDPPTLSKEGCPDLTGRYRLVSELDSWIQLGVDPIELAAMITWPRPKQLPIEELKKNPIYTERIEIPKLKPHRYKVDEDIIFLIKQSPENIVLEAYYDDHTKRQTLHLNHPSNGCFDGAFISRHVTIKSGGDTFTGGSVGFSQIETRKLNNGSLQVTYSSGGKPRSLWTGQAIGKLGSPMQKKIVVYPSANKP